jgi:queuosine precursor transporter
MFRTLNSSPLKAPKVLWFLMLSYTMSISLANWFDARLVHVFGIDTDAGTLIFPLTFLLSDLITEVYGYKNARLAIWVGALFNLLFVAYGQLVIHLPSPNYPTHNEMFDTVLQLDSRVIIASFASYFISEPLNSYILAKLKLKTRGRYLGFRFVASTVVASAIDSFIFAMGAFYGTLAIGDLLLLIVVMWCTKVVIEVVGLPVSISLTKKLKRIEHTDIYDINTNFTVLSLDSTYTAEQNFYVGAGVESR